MAKYFDSVSEIENILLGGNFEELVGAVENKFFEAKGEPWQLAHEIEKFKFARDVTAMANSRGGIILVGIAANKPPNRRRDEVLEKQRFLPDSLAPGDRYMQVVSDWVYPVPEGIEIRWHSYTKDPSRGVIGIRIPNQDDELRPFFVKKYFEEAGKRFGTALCIVQRFEATMRETPYQEVHTLLREGRRVDLIHQKLDAILAKLEAGGRSVQE